MLLEHIEQLAWLAPIVGIGYTSIGIMTRRLVLIMIIFVMLLGLVAAVPQSITITGMPAVMYPGATSTNTFNLSIGTIPGLGYKLSVRLQLYFYGGSSLDNNVDIGLDGLNSATATSRSYEWDSTTSVTTLEPGRIIPITVPSYLRQQWSTYLPISINITAVRVFYNSGEVTATPYYTAPPASQGYTTLVYRTPFPAIVNGAAENVGDLVTMAGTGLWQTKMSPKGPIVGPRGSVALGPYIYALLCPSDGYYCLFHDQVPRTPHTHGVCCCLRSCV